MESCEANAMKVEDEESYLRIPLVGSMILQLTLKAMLDLGVFEILIKGCVPHGAGDKPVLMMTAADIARQLPTENSQAASMLDRMLRLLASFNIVECSMDRMENVVRRYGPSPIFKWLAKNADGSTAAKLVHLAMEQAFISSGLHIKDAVLEGGTAFEKAHGMTTFQYKGTNSGFSRIFDEAMEAHSTLTVKKILETYQGFKDVKILVDVGGGVGATLDMIIAKYPHIKCINLDLPDAISNAPSFPGVEHVGGDMFDCIPHGDAILLKWVLHNWSDEHCVKILKNCYVALPNDGKVIVIDYLLPATPQETIRSQSTYILDVMMMIHFGGKERTQGEFKTLAEEAGFTKLEVHYGWGEMWIIELRK